MNAEFQSLAVNVVGQRLETSPVCGRWKSIERGNQAAIFVHRERRAGLVVVPLRVWLVPLNVDDDVLPSVLSEMLRHPVGISFDLRLPDRRAVRVPTIPAHRRRRRGRIGCESGNHEGCDQDREREESWHCADILCASLVSWRGHSCPRKPRRRHSDQRQRFGGNFNRGQLPHLTCCLNEHALFLSRKLVQVTTFEEDQRFQTFGRLKLCASIHTGGGC